MAHPGARSRKTLKEINEVLPLPNLIEIQTDSYKWFTEEGLKELFAEINPIEDFTGKNLALYLRDFHFEEPKYDEKTAKIKNASYEVPLKGASRIGEQRDRRSPRAGDLPR